MYRISPYGRNDNKANLAIFATHHLPKDTAMLSIFPELSTKRLDLIEIRQAHLNDYYRLFSDERVTKYYNIIPFKEEGEAQKYIDWFKTRFSEWLGIRWGIALKGESSIIGTVGFNSFQKNHKANIGYDLRIEHWGKGYITEALSEVVAFGFTSLEVNRIEAEIMQGNIASEKVLTKLGFAKEGVLRDWMYWNNEHYDMTIYSLLKKDFERQQRTPLAANRLTASK